MLACGYTWTPLLHKTFSCYVQWWWWLVYALGKVLRRIAITHSCIWKEVGFFNHLDSCTYVAGLLDGHFHWTSGQYTLTQMNTLQACVASVTCVIGQTVLFVPGARTECAAHLDYVTTWIQCCPQTSVDSFFITQLNSDIAVCVKYALKLRV